MRNLLPNPYLLGVGIAILSYVLLWLSKKILTTRVARFTGNTKNKWDDTVVFTMERTSTIFMVVSSLYIGYLFIPHPASLDTYVSRIFFVFLMWQIAIWSHHLLEKWILQNIRIRTQRNPAAASSISLIQLLARMIVFSVIFLFTLSNLGIKITTIIAGLGVGGIAVALALQKILGDLFSSLSIVLDKPFVVGDFIVVDSFLGAVEKIGLKTTRLRSLSGEQIIISNSDLLGTRIRNYKRMHERRVALIFSLPHTTTTDKLRSAVDIISRTIGEKNRVRFERCHFMRINTTLDIETVYWVLSDDYNMHMDIQQDILHDIREAFLADEISFAYPTQTIHLVPGSFPPKQKTLDSLHS
jgi:small-conductance mechanosensitive channel